MKRFLPRAIGRAAAAAGLCAALASGCGPRGAGEIRVVTEPPGATVFCNGVRYDVTPLALTRRPPGLHLIVAEKEGFRTARRSVTLLEGQRLLLELRLEPETALVRVESEPPGAEVQLNGAFRGRTPFFIHDLPFGEHRFHFEKPGYLPRDIVERFDSRPPRDLRVELVPNVGRLVARSVPAGARVRVNGAERGVTPCEIEDVAAGDVAVEIELDGFETYAETFPIAARQTREVAATLKPFPTQLSVVSLPPGARLYVNNQYRGDTPQKLTDLQPGEVRLRVEKPGYETAARTIQLRSRTPAVEEFRLTKNSGKLVVITEPPNVKVFLNGEEKGETLPGANPMISEPLEIDLLPPGEYRLSLLRPGFQHAPKTIRIAANAVVDVQERLARRFVPDTRVRIRGASGEMIRDGMLINVLPDGAIELQLESRTIMRIEADEIISREPLPPRN